MRRGEEQNIFPFQEDADVMFNSALIYELACLKSICGTAFVWDFQGRTGVYRSEETAEVLLNIFVPVPSEAVPNNSILREFIGGSCFNV